MDTTVESESNAHINEHTSVGMDCIILTPLNMINLQLTLPNFSPLLKTTNNILVNMKLKGHIYLATHMGKLYDLIYKTTNMSLPKNKITNTKFTYDEINRAEAIY